MVPLFLKSKAALIVITAAVASTGTIAGILLSQHHAAAAAAESAGVPLPMAPPSASPGSATPDNAQVLSGSVPVAYSPVSPGPGGVPLATAAPQTMVGLSPDQLNELLGPIALYPDPLIAEMLPASTYPDHLAAAALWLRGNPTPPEELIQAQPWEPCIKGLAHSPSVLIWMYNNPDWTRTLGTAFTYQSQDVMSSIQTLRGMALASGTLTDTSQQVIVMEGQDICVEPAMTDVVYVPVYDWRTCYTRRDTPTFFAAARIGSWFDGDCDWDGHFVTIGARWNLGWEHRWDDDHNAHPVVVREARGGEQNGRPATLINNTTIVNNNHTVKVGGTPWQRNDVRPAPSLPNNVHPGGHDIRLDQSRQPAIPDRGRAPDKPVVSPPERQGRSVAPIVPDNGGAAPGVGGNRGNPGGVDRGNPGGVDRGNPGGVDRGNPGGADRGNVGGVDRGNPGRGNPGNGRGNPGRDNNG